MSAVPVADRARTGRRRAPGTAAGPTGCTTARSACRRRSRPGRLPIASRRMSRLHQARAPTAELEDGHGRSARSSSARRVRQPAAAAPRAAGRRSRPRRAARRRSSGSAAASSRAPPARPAPAPASPRWPRCRSRRPACRRSRGRRASAAGARPAREALDARQGRACSPRRSGSSPSTTDRKEHVSVTVSPVSVALALDGPARRRRSTTARGPRGGRKRICRSTPCSRAVSRT